MLGCSCRQPGAPLPPRWSGLSPWLLALLLQIFARVVGALGGRAAEEVVFGDAEVTSGASGDLQQVRGRGGRVRGGGVFFWWGGGSW
jgi:uracil-DNA glycosylase